MRLPAALHRCCCTLFIAPFGYGHSLKDTVLDITSELEGSKNGIHISDMRFMEFEIINIHTEVCITHQRIHFTVKKDLVDAAAQGFTFFAPNFRCVLDYPLQPAKLIDPFCRVPVADSWDTRDIIGLFPSHRSQVRVLCRGYFIFLAYRFRGHRLQVFEMVSRIKHGYRIIDKLEGVPVP